MKIGVIGLGETGTEIVGRLLRRTCHDLLVYDPDQRDPDQPVRLCKTAAEVCDACGILILALDSTEDQVALSNGVASFLHPQSIVVDFTKITPAQAHKNANHFRRSEIAYLDCALFSSNGLEEPCTCFVGGNGEAFTRICPLLRCIVPDCHHMGPAGRGQAVRVLSLSLTASIETCVDHTLSLAEAIGIREDYFLEVLSRFNLIANPLHKMTQGASVFESIELWEAARIASEMDARAKQLQQGLAHDGADPL